MKGLMVRLAGGVVLFDFCFWKMVNTPGLAVSVFFTGLTLLLFWGRRERKIGGTAGGVILLMAGATGASVVETSASNGWVFFFLTIVLAGELQFSAISPAWGRWISQAVALLRAPGRPFWLLARLLEAGGQRESRPARAGFTGVIIAGPALLLAMLFGLLLASGNPVFEQWSNQLFQGFWERLWPYLNAMRVLFWLFGAFLLLPLLTPVTPGEWWWRWSLQLPRLRLPIAEGAARLSSLLVLGVLNVLFLTANLADTLFLWSGRSLPAGVTYSHYVHEGVLSLVTAVILSALVLTVVFQQDLAIARRRELKVLAYVWIGQNLFLLVSVALRLKLYIEAYDMSVERLSVLLFLVMVAVGYLLLTIKIRKEKSLSWLLGGGILAAFGTLYVAQFLNLAGWSAEYNVWQWEADRSKKLDVEYLEGLGAPAWPAILRFRLKSGAPADREFREWTDLEDGRILDDHWQEWSLREWRNRPFLEAIERNN